MKLSYVEVSGFRGYRDKVRLEFGGAFAVIDGRNGVGKSTIFDAIEFALTGAVSKYGDAKADGETIADYLWWMGDGEPEHGRYVAVGFVDGDEKFDIRRSQFESIDTTELAGKLFEAEMAPEKPFEQICMSTIIRDEHITGLSLDMKEADRFQLLRNALGSSDADEWIERGKALVSAAKKRTDAANRDAVSTNADVGNATRRLDEVRGKLASNVAIAEATERVRKVTESSGPIDDLLTSTRKLIVDWETRLGGLERIIDGWDGFRAMQVSISALKAKAEATSSELSARRDAFAALPVPTQSTSDVGNNVRDLTTLLALGRTIGRAGEHCPLCAARRTAKEFDDGLAKLESSLKALNEQVTVAIQLEQTRDRAQRELDAAEKAYSDANAEVNRVTRASAEIEALLTSLQIADLDSKESVVERADSLRRAVSSARTDLRTLETLLLSSDLESAQRAENDAKARFAKAQERYGKTRKAESYAQSLFDAARRAASETLDARLERVLPIMSELYQRLRPHPHWVDINYSIRGDVRRFMILQVGEALNPQFLFSSGQRRATGLAFLLSVKLSVAWSRWNSILMDDPVQHIDDFRAIHLAEVCAQLVRDGWQIVCAVEDAALADLLCRRLPVDELGVANRITLGVNAGGQIGVVRSRHLLPMMQRALVGTEGRAAG